MKKQALLIGINDYLVLSGLKYARQDAQSMADAIKTRYGFLDSEITLMTCSSPGATRATSRFIEQVLMDMTDCRDLDFCIFGFWGHGFSPQPGRRYLCGIDTFEQDLERTAVSLDLIKAKLAQVGAMNTLLILDCCQNRPLGRSADAAVLDQGAEQEFDNITRDIQVECHHDDTEEKIPTVAMLHACREGQRAYEWDDRQHGVFTAHLLDGIDKGHVSIAKLATWVSDRTPKTVRKLHREQQMPWFTIKGRGDIELPIESMASLTPEISTERIIVSPIRTSLSTWYVVLDGKEKGPLEESTVLNLIRQGKITRHSECWCQDMDHWQSISEVKHWRHHFPPERKPRTPTAFELMTNAIGMKLVWIPPGEFIMGSPIGETERNDDEGLVHKVRLSHGFWMGMNEVTQAEYRAVMGENPSYFKGDDLPVEQVSWNAAVLFCEKISARLAQTYCLPTESQWEYACRSGTSTPFYYGETICSDQANYDARYIYHYGTKGQFRKKTVRVGSSPPNAFGLYEMHGNVWEWCQDWYGRHYYSKSPSDDPKGPENGTYRVLRGGSWYAPPRCCRSAFRHWVKPNDTLNTIGFRVAINNHTY